MIQYIRQAITTNGGTPQSFSVIGALREIVTVYGGTPTQYSVVGLLREAVTALNIQPGTTSASVFYNAQGYQAP